MKIDLKESLNELDIISDNKYDLYNTYLAENPDIEKKKRLVEAIYKNKSPKDISLILKEDWGDVKSYYEIALKQADEDAETLRREYDKGDKSIFDILLGLGYISDDPNSVYMYKEVDNGNAIIFDLEPFDTEDCLRYFVLDEYDKIPRGYTSTKIFLNESLKEDFTEDDLVKGKKFVNKNGVEITIVEPTKDGKVQFIVKGKSFSPDCGGGSKKGIFNMLKKNGYSLKEDVSKEWKPNLNFKHIKDVLEKALSRGKYINNEREEVKAALDLCDKKQKYTPEQRKFIQDSHREMWKKNRKTESLDDIHNDFEIGRKYWNRLNLDIDFDSALDKWNKSSELAEPDTWYSKPLYSKEAWNDMVSMFSNIDESLNEKMVRVEASEEDINDVVGVLNKHGFKLDDNFKPGRGLFGSYHIQVINPDLTYIDDDQFVKAIEPLADDLDSLSTAINMPITYNFGANEDGIVTAGVDIHVGYKDGGMDESLKKNLNLDDFMEPVDQVGKAKIYYDPYKRTYFTPSLDLDFETLDQAKDFIGAPLYMGESLNESKKYKDLYFGEINFKLKNESDKQKAEQIMSSVFGDDKLEGGKFSFRKTKSGYILKYYGNIGSIYYEKYFKEFIKKMKNLGVQIQYKPESPKYSKNTYIVSLDDEEKVKDFLSKSLKESSDYYSTKKPLNHRITSKNWNEFISLIENETGLYVEAPNKYSQWIELIDFDDRVTYDVEITKYMDGTYELVPDNISSPLKSKE